jgi:hypothetical protein
MNTNTLAFRIVLLGILILSSAATAFAQAPGSTAAGAVGFTFTFDEYGNSLLNGGPNPLPVVFPAGGGIQYFLPQLVVPGDVVVLNSADVSPTNIAGISDLLSFSNQGNQGVLLFQSLIDDNDPPAPADVLSFPLNAAFTVGESGPEGFNTFQWIPDPANAAGAVYNGVSDGMVPEPSTFVLGAGLGIISLVVARWRRHRSVR